MNSYKSLPQGSLVVPSIYWSIDQLQRLSDNLRRKAKKAVKSKKG
jgi:hypothetical protein